MALSASIDVRELAGVQRALAAVERAYGSPRPLLKALGAASVRQTEQRFRDQVDPRGSAWPKTTDFTRSTRPGGGGGGRTLSDTGRLRQSIQASEPTSNEVVIGPSNVEYASIHQTGGTVRAKNAKKLTIPMTRQARQKGPRRYISTAEDAVWILKNESTGAVIGKKIRRGAAAGSSTRRSGGGGGGWEYIGIGEREGTGKDARIKWAFAAKKSVDIPRREYMGVSDNNREEFAAIIIGAGERAIRQELGKP